MTLLPPPQYDVPPTIPVIEHVLSWSEVQLSCFDLTAKWNGVAEAQTFRARGGWLGCSGIYSDGKCYVWRIDDDTVRRHELAHCNGWPKDHPLLSLAPFFENISSRPPPACYDWSAIARRAHIEIVKVRHD